MVNSFLNGKKKLSPAASDRVMLALNAGFAEKKDADESRQADAPLGDLVDESLDVAELGQYEAFADVRKAFDSSFGFLSAREAPIILGGPPRDPVKYKAWKAKQIELLSSAKELPIAKTWIKHLEQQRSHFQKEILLLEQVKSSRDEVVFLYQGLVERSKKQLQDAGITPTG
jgi:hypothetical protein